MIFYDLSRKLDHHKCCSPTCFPHPKKKTKPKIKEELP